MTLFEEVPIMTDDIRLIQASTVGEVNDGAFLIFDYFKNKAGDIKNFDTSNYSRLDDIVTKTLSGKHKLIVAYIGNTPVGVGGVNDHGELQHLYVDPEHRGKRIAEQLVRNRLSIGAWYAVVHKDNVASQSLMSKCGLRPYAQYGEFVMFVVDKSVSN